MEYNILVLTVHFFFCMSAHYYLISVNIINAILEVIQSLQETRIICNLSESYVCEKDNHQ